MTRKPAADAVPRSTPWFFRGFRKYARRFVGRNFHALRIDRDGRPTNPPGPAIVALNHASWWDPMTALLATELFPPSRIHFAPIDELGLKQYPILERLGFFGVQLETPRGGIAFMRRASAILARTESMLWITPQGQFVDPRDRPVRFKEGLGRLLHRERGIFIAPMAVEYPFWNDRRPEALVRFGPWIAIGDGASQPADAWTRQMEAALEDCQDRLMESSRSRDVDRFETFVRGSAGVGGIYDIGRRLRSMFRGETFSPEHQVHQHQDSPPS
ncbi:lysophospholipid acyltransferase family protein [Paludisphaera rhizosphaerae]|uniref:lysophospholipid acyltransferase family protein n=1 Tax=Paludisphaera rhizosphaerae TaxID=2711216 RepID=UPI0013ECBEA0|nr:lysophospholipid acyltransferase family protein [Paludisphaera rhizosphaerae]